MFSLFLFYTRESVENEQILFSNYKEKKKNKIDKKRMIKDG